jgi:hypothetical protein
VITPYVGICRTSSVGRYLLARRSDGLRLGTQPDLSRWHKQTITAMPRRLVYPGDERTALAS